MKRLLARLFWPVISKILSTFLYSSVAMTVHSNRTTFVMVTMMMMMMAKVFTRWVSFQTHQLAATT